MSSPSDTPKCVASSSMDMKEVVEISSTKKVSTSCDKKDESCKNDSGDSSGIDIVSDRFVTLEISNDDVDKINLSDDELFQDPPPKEDCPICMLPMPYASSGCGVTTIYMPCCGKIICEGCSMAEDDEIEKGNIKPWCALCRVPIHSSNEEYIKRLKKRMQLNDAEAIYKLGTEYCDGEYGLPQDLVKATELWTKAAELGSINAHCELARAYHSGEGVEFDMDKAIEHLVIAAIGGYESARDVLGVLEEANGNMGRAMKHFIIAAKSGYDECLKKVGEGYKDGYVTKDEYAATLRAYQCSINEMKSKQRDIAAAHDE